MQHSELDCFLVEGCAIGRERKKSNRSCALPWALQQVLWPGVVSGKLGLQCTKGYGTHVVTYLPCSETYRDLVKEQAKRTRKFATNCWHSASVGY